MPIASWAKNLRDIVGTDCLVMVAASTIVTDEHGRLLLQQRSDNGLWGLPGGGIDPGEEPAAAAIREVHEETGLDVSVNRLIGVFGGKDLIVSYLHGDQVAYVSIAFECHVIGGKIIPDPDESKAVQWFDPDHLPAQFMEKHRIRIHTWQKEQMPYFEIPEIDFQSLSQSNYMQSMRQQVGHLLLMSSGATGIIFDEKGHVLVQKRRDNGLWNIPSGLYEIGEEAAETAMREIYEETGLIVRPTRLVGVYGGADYLHTYPNGDQVSFINIVFVCEIVAGELNSNNIETDELCFVSPENLPEPFTEKHRILIDHAVSGEEAYFTR